MLQWRVMRVYSIDWYENQERALNQILDELKLAEAGVFEKEEQEETASYVFDAERIKDSGIVDDVTRNKAMLPYRECIIPFAVDKDSFNPYDQRYAVIVKRIVQDEQPITEDYLCKRLAKVMGFGHAGSNIQKLVSSVVSSLYRDPLSIDGEYSFWLNEASAQGYLNYRAPSPRNITEIPAIEIVNAIREVVEEEFSLPKDKIPTIAARKLGFASSGAKINEVIMAALNLMEQNGIVKTNNDSVSLI